MAKREQQCADGGVECLQRLYDKRVSQLTALTVESRVTEKRLDSLAIPFSLVGTWKATGIRDPEGGSPSGGNARESLQDAGLPDLGKLVTATPGLVCVAGREQCLYEAWQRKPLSQVEFAAAKMRVLKLTPSTAVLLGDSGAKEVPQLLLLPGNGNTLQGIFTLCKPNAQDCHYALETLEPVERRVASPTKP